MPFDETDTTRTKLRERLTVVMSLARPAGECDA